MVWPLHYFGSAPLVSLLIVLTWILSFVERVNVPPRALVSACRAFECDGPRRIVDGEAVVLAAKGSSHNDQAETAVISSKL
jgi:hypothetical protein